MNAREILDLARAAEALVKRGAPDAQEMLSRAEQEAMATEDLLGRLGGCCVSERNRHDLQDERLSLDAAVAVIRRARGSLAVERRR